MGKEMVEMGRMTENDSVVLRGIGAQERAMILYEYLCLGMNQKDVAADVLGGDERGDVERVSVVTRAYGFHERMGKGKYKQVSPETFFEFVQTYSPEDIVNGLDVGTLDAFLKRKKNAKGSGKQASQPEEYDPDEEEYDLDEEDDAPSWNSGRGSFSSARRGPSSNARRAAFSSVRRAVSSNTRRIPRSEFQRYSHRHRGNSFQNPIQGLVDSPFGKIVLIILALVLINEIFGSSVYDFLTTGIPFKIIIGVMAVLAIIGFLRANMPAGVKVLIIVIIGLPVLYEVLGPTIYEFLTTGVVFAAICKLIALGVTAAMFLSHINMPFFVKLMVAAVIWMTVLDM